MDVIGLSSDRDQIRWRISGYAFHCSGATIGRNGRIHAIRNRDCHWHEWLLLAAQGRVHTGVSLVSSVSRPWQLDQNCADKKKKKAASSCFSRGPVAARRYGAKAESMRYESFFISASAKCPLRNLAKTWTMLFAFMVFCIRESWRTSICETLRNLAQPCETINCKRLWNTAKHC